jgi:TonB family protein
MGLAAATALGLALVGTAAPAVAVAQPSATAAPSCLAQVTATDSVTTMLNLALGLRHPPSATGAAVEPSLAELEALALALQHLHAAVTVPRDLAISLLGHDIPFEVVGDSMRRPQLVHPAVSGRIAFTLHADGHVSRISLEAPSISAPLDSALLATLRREGAAGTLWNLVAPPARDSVRLWLATTHGVDARRVSTPFVRLRLPLYPGMPVVSVGTAFPRYPRAAQSQGVTGSVRMQFVVDTLGHVARGSERVIAANDPIFERAVRRVLPDLRFTPRRVAGCVMRQHVQQSFVFALQ